VIVIFHFNSNYGPLHPIPFFFVAVADEVDHYRWYVFLSGARNTSAVGERKKREEWRREESIFCCVQRCKKMAATHRT
jgi:hypothetical protein